MFTETTDIRTVKGWAWMRLDPLLCNITDPNGSLQGSKLPFNSTTHVFLEGKDIRFGEM